MTDNLDIRWRVVRALSDAKIASNRLITIMQKNPRVGASAAPSMNAALEALAYAVDACDRAREAVETLDTVPYER